MSCTPNLTEIPENVIFKENLNLGYGTLTDDCADVWTKIGIHTLTREVNVVDFGADSTGIVNSTAAFTAAMAAGNRILIPHGLYAVNLVITGKNYTFVGQDSDYADSGTVGLVPFDPTNPVVQIGDGTISTSSINFINVQIRSRSGVAAAKGLRFYGCNRCRIVNSVIRGCDTYNIQLDSSAARETFFIHFIGCNIGNTSVAGSIGVDFNYGSQYVSGIYFTNCDLNGNNGGGFIVDLEANCTINFANCWIQCWNNAGFKVRANTARIIGTNTQVDSNTATDTLLTFDFDSRVPDIVFGNITFDGKASLTSGLTVSLIGRNFIPFDSIISFPTIIGSLGFQDAAGANNTQHANAPTNQRIDRSGTTLFLRSDDGDVQARPVATGVFDVFGAALEIRGNAIAGHGNLVFGKASQTTVGAAGGASALPATPTGYLRFFLGSVEFVIPYYARV